ncbi:MAG: DHHW family protein [Oscillospiraceae bacterium]
MKVKTMKKIVFFGVLLLIPFFALFARYLYSGAYLQEVKEQPADFAQGLEGHLQASLPFSRSLRRLSLSIDLAGGKWEQDGIFISAAGLMRGLEPTMPQAVDVNTLAILEFAEDYQNEERRVYLAILPTASGVRQQNLPRFSSTANQRNFIESTYNRFSGAVTTIAVYNTLLDKRDQYIYCRTEDNLTALGGYYVYEQMLGRMLSSERSSLSQYDISYLQGDYHGDLYQAVPYGGVQPDTLMFYRYGEVGREYTVTKVGQDYRKVYHTLYPEFLGELGEPMDAYLGGMSPVTVINTNVPGQRRLLVFGDRTALAYLPFLANHYSEIVLLDVTDASSVFLEAAPMNYSQILFACGADTYMNSTAIATALSLTPQVFQ